MPPWMQHSHRGDDRALSGKCVDVEPHLLERPEPARLQAHGDRLEVIPLAGSSFLEGVRLGVGRGQLKREEIWGQAATREGNAQDIRGERAGNNMKRFHVVYRNRLPKRMSIIVMTVK